MAAHDTAKSRSIGKNWAIWAIPLALLALVVGVACQRTAVEASSPARSSTTAAPDEVAPSALGRPGDLARMIPIADKAKKPFANARKADEFPKDAEWLNTGGPIRLRDLKGKFVLLDFWTYCCINCMHILPELKKLEHEFPNELVVIGVHSAKFEGEKETKNIADAILRYEIEHPVVNDADHAIWESFGVQSWPSIVLIDPEGNEVGQHSGEFKAELIEAVLKKAIPYYRENKLLSDTPMRFDLLAERQPKTPLRFPGKVMADGPGKRLFIADSNHNRIVIAGMDGKLQQIYGTGEVGLADGGPEKATFNHPQGMVLHGDTLYVADTENHMLRKIDLKNKKVSTVSGTGEQARMAFPGMDRVEKVSDIPDRWIGKPKETALNSPWDLWIHEQTLYIAMAGPHQIWTMPLDEKEIGPYSGNGREDIVDGRLLPRLPYDNKGFASFAQPSGLTSDGKWLYVADSEGSSVRAVPFDKSEEVRTLVGTSHLPYGRLFHFGDVDGVAEKVKLQHCLGVAYHDGQIFVADTYNNKIKVVNAETGETKTLVGGKQGTTDDPPLFNEPAGLSYADGKLYVADTDNHLIRVVDVASKQVTTIQVEGLAPPTPKKNDKKPSFASAAKVKVPAATVKPVDGKVKFEVAIEIPEGWKTNPLAKVSYWVEAEGGEGALERGALGKKTLDPPAAKFSIELPAKGGGDTVTISMPFYYCQEGAEGVCKVGSVVFTIPLKVDPQAEAASVKLTHRVAE